jgi:hypothetical protein
MATQRFRRNTISGLKTENGDIVSNHQQMAGIILSKFKERMGQSRGIKMGFNLDRILQLVEGLDLLTRDFEKEEMDLIIKHMPADKASGPDGFNGLFLKKCWPIIAKDLNSSFISLIPKNNSPKGVNDYRHISLTNVYLKFITKMTANRLQDHILR